MNRRVFITVAEASADQHAGNLIRSLKELDSDIVVEGLGGPKMRSAGATIHHETTAGAAMMWQAALRAREVSGWLKWTEKYFDQNKIDLQICCDSWSMNWHFAKVAKERGIPVLYYIAPQTWASREGRIARLAEYTDQVACILPFEEQYFRTRGVNATFVGHPLFDQLPAERTHTKVYELNKPVIGILPGSRLSISKQNFPRQMKVAHRILKTFPNARFIIPTTEVTHEFVTKVAAGRPGFEIVKDGFDQVVPQCDFCVTVSGTAALHVAAYGVPMIVVYYGNPILWNAIGRWVVTTRTYSLVNILSGKPEKIVPEFIPWYGSTQSAADRVIWYLRHPDQMQLQSKELTAVVRTLDRKGASMNVAKMAIEMMNPQPTEPANTPPIHS